MGPIFKADLRPRRPRGSVELEQGLIYAAYREVINSVLSEDDAITPCLLMLTFHKTCYKQPPCITSNRVKN